MGILAITTVLIGSLTFFLLGLTMRVILRNEGHRYTEAANQIMQAAAFIPVIYGIFVLLIGLAPLH